MTAVATPPPEATARGPAPPATAPSPVRRRRDRPPPSLELWSEVALAAVTVVTVAGLWRLFLDQSFAVPLLAHAVVAHIVVTVLRRRGLGIAASGAVVAGLATVAVVWGHLWHTTFAGLPTTETFRVAGDRLTEAWRAFGHVEAPTEVLPGFVLALVVVVWAVAWLADLAAFRLWAPFEAIIPAGTVFLFASIFGADDARLLAAALWFAAALAFVLIYRVARQQASPSWLGSDPRGGSNAMLRNGAVLGLLAVTLSLLTGPRLPGHDAAAIVGPDAFDSDSSRQTVSPLVEIKGRLLDQSNAELFSVTSVQRAYWRLTSLDIFDGNVWSSRGTFGRADGELEGLAEEIPGSAAITQSVQITGLSTIWVPAAFEARVFEPGDADVRWEPESSTLIVSTDHPTSDGLEYQVTSAIPTFEPEALRAATGHIPRGVATRALGLPVGFPTRVSDEARRVVADATTPYDQARALQDYFRSGAFEYSLAAPSGHSDTAIESFLFDTKTGYCEQFAGTYAAMARAVGLPARVAVGFTPGEQDPIDPNRYVVRGEHAHAWPEVYLSGVGWVAFEPTPGRGAPGALAYTGVEESQDTPGPSTDPSLTTGLGPQFPTELGAEGLSPDGSTTTLPPDPGFGDEGVPAAGDEGVDGRDILRFTGWIVLGGAAIGVLVVLAGASTAAWRAVRRLRRRIRAATADDRVRVAWAEAVESVEVLGVTPSRHETPLEFARRLGAAIDGDPRPRPLAVVVERADFAPDGVSDDQADEATKLSHGIRAAVHHRTTARQRVLAAADPRSPARRGRNRGPRPTGPRIQIHREIG